MSKVVLTYVKDDENVPIQKLSLLDQVLVLFRKMTRDPSEKIRAQSVLSQEDLTLKASLIKFLEGATRSIREGRNECIKLKMSSKFDPVIDSVLSMNKFSKYYKITIQRPEIEYDVHHYYTMWMEVLR
jgi:ssDNA-specific exonuclease RecJ